MVAIKEKVKNTKYTKIKLSEIVANSGQTRGFGVLPQLKELGYGLFEKASADPEKGVIWEQLFSDDPAERKKMSALIREHEPQVVSTSESLDEFGQLQPIRVVKTTDGYDVVFGMTRAIAAAMLHAEDSKHCPDEVDAIVMDEIKPLEMKLMGFAENNDRHGESPIDKAIFFKELKEDFSMSPKEIGMKIGFSDQYVRDHIKLLSPKLEDVRMEIHEGSMPVDKALKKLKKLKEGSSDDADSNGTPSGDRIRFPAVKKLLNAYDSKKKPEWMQQKEWEMFVKDDTRRWMAYRLGKKFKPFSGELVTKEEPPEEEQEPTPKLFKIKIPKSVAVKLLTALGKPESEGWTDDQLKEKLENVVNIAEPNQKLESEKLQSLLEKLVSHYKTGLEVTIK